LQLLAFTFSLSKYAFPDQTLEVKSQVHKVNSRKMVGPFEEHYQSRPLLELEQGMSTSKQRKMPKTDVVDSSGRYQKIMWHQLSIQSFPR
jgi:hypothetical protein